MANTGDVLSKAIAAMAEEKSVARRRSIANEAHVALRQLLEAKPAETADEAEKKGYARGLIVATDLLAETLREHVEPLSKVDVGRAYAVLNGVSLLVRSVCSGAESRMGREAFAMTRLTKEP